ncbi:MAG: hypothetical protein COB66_07930 [Coxiella sp. (in: Bacteria)]|nr:MAG: hypothetical protein COB66_07930 [Coxiella sp. (in: g-proteobacteria)]
MKILLEQVFNSGDRDEKRITLIDSTIDNKQDAVRAVEALHAFDTMMLCCGCFTDNDHIILQINNDDVGYAQLNDWEDLVEFLGGSI